MLFGPNTGLVSLAIALAGIAVQQWQQVQKRREDDVAKEKEKAETAKEEERQRLADQEQKKLEKLEAEEKARKERLTQIDQLLLKAKQSTAEAVKLYNKLEEKSLTEEGWNTDEAKARLAEVKTKLQGLDWYPPLEMEATEAWRNGDFRLARDILEEVRKFNG